MRIFLDANVLFSAAKSNGAVRRLLDLLIEAGHECWADGFVAEEARRNLAAKFPEGLSVLNTLLSRLRTGPIHTPDPALEDALPLPEKDRPVLSAAIRHDCEALVTGDRTHFGRLYGKAIHGVTIHSPRSIAEALLADALPAPKVLRQPRKRYAVSAQPAKLRIPREKIAALCRKYGVRKLSLFGSAARDELTPKSDVDLIVEFKPGEAPSLWDFPKMQDSFSALFGNRKVDIASPEILRNPYRRKTILPDLKTLYEARH
jgi:predicted nucleotidyltransferase/predicted nucleic acid-binding protein